MFRVPTDIGLLSLWVMRIAAATAMTERQNLPSSYIGLSGGKLA